MKSVWTGFALLFVVLTTLAQEGNFEKRLKLKVLDQSTIEWWHFGATSISCFSEGIWEHVLPKSTLGTTNIVLNRNELDYFLELDGIKVKTETEAVSNPEHWENRFGKQIQTLTLSKPLTFLAIKNGELVQFSVDTLVGLHYATYYPFGELDVPDHNLVPIVFEQKNEFDEHSPVLLVSSTFMHNMDFNEVKLHWDKVAFGSENMAGLRYVIGLDFNGDGQDEVLTYHETTQEYEPSEDDVSVAYEHTLIGLYFKNQWYRTSFWQEGPDGVEGF